MRASSAISRQARIARHYQEFCRVLGGVLDSQGVLEFLLHNFLILLREGMLKKVVWACSTMP